MRSKPLGKKLAAAAALAALGWIVGAAGCDSPSEPGQTSKAMEERMREIEKRMKDSLPKTQEIALAQKADPEVVKKAQGQLKVLQEYLEDTPSGKIDMVTVNAIEAFQRRVGLHEDGLLNEETLKRLDEAAKKAASAPAPATG